MKNGLVVLGVLLGGIGFSPTAQAGSGMSGGAFSQWVKISKGENTMNAMGGTARMSKKMKRMVLMKSSRMNRMKNTDMGEGMGIFDDMETGMKQDARMKKRSMGSALGLRKMNSKSTMQATGMNTDSSTQDTMQAVMPKEMKKRMRKQMDKSMEEEDLKMGGKEATMPAAAPMEEAPAVPEEM